MSDSAYLTTIQLSHLLASQIGINGDQALIIDSIFSCQSEVSEANLHDVIMLQFHVDMDAGRMHSSVNSLVKANKLSRLENTLLLTPDAIEEISSVISQNELYEKTAVDEWIDQCEIMLARPLCNDENVVVKHCLLDFIRRFFLTHGADCYKLICGEKQTEYSDLDTIAHECSQVENVELRVPLQDFLSGLFTNSLSVSQSTFLLNQLKKAINYMSTVVDAKTQQLLGQKIAGLTLYLDTTVLYRLFNLQGEKRHESIEKLIGFCKAANVTLKVLQTTVDEMRRRIGYDSRVILEHPTPVSFASIGYQCRTSENYISTFWCEQSHTGISAIDFNYRFSNLKMLLDDAGIEIDDTDYVADEKINTEKSLLKSKVSQYGSTDPLYQKSPNAIEHDAECIAVVRHHQKSNVQTVLEGQTAFLTTDWNLIRIQRNDYQYRDKVDFAILPSQIIQIFCMTAPTTCYLEAFLGLFSSSHTFFGSNTLSNEQIQLIMGRVAYYKGATPTFAEKVLMNQLIQNTFTDKETEDEQNELIREAILEEVEGMEAALTKNAEELASKTEQIAQIESDNTNKDTHIGGLLERVTALEERTVQAENQEITYKKYEKKVKNIIENRAAFKASLRIVGGLLIMLIGICILLICVLSLIPPFSHLVMPLIDWLKSSDVIKDETGVNGLLISILVPIGLAAISAGFIVIKPGYKDLKAKYIEREMVLIIQ